MSTQPSDNGMTPIMMNASRMPHKSRPVASFKRVGTRGGAVFYLPDSSSFSSMTGKELRSASDSVVSIFEYLQLIAKQDGPSSSRGTQRPNWASNYLLPQERELAENISIKSEQVQTLTDQLQHDREALRRSEWLMDIIATDGAQLEQAVVRIFDEMGLRASDGPDKLADGFVLIGNQLLVLEIKGYKGAAKEGALSQCNRWLADTRAAIDSQIEDGDQIIDAYRQKLVQLDSSLSEPSTRAGLTVRGVVICNTFFELDLYQRPRYDTQLTEHFPDAFQSRAKLFDIACLSGVQLLALFNHSRVDGGKTKDQLSKLAHTAGPSLEFQDWTQLFPKVDTIAEHGTSSGGN